MPITVRNVLLLALLCGVSGWSEAVVISDPTVVRVAWDQAGRDSIGSNFGLGSSAVAGRERSTDGETHLQGCTFIKFDLGALSPDVVNDAAFRISFSVRYNARVNGDNAQRAAMRVVASANTWADATGAYPLATWVGPANLGSGITIYDHSLVTNALVDVPPKTISIDVTQDVRDWVNGVAPNNGYAVFATTDSNQGTGFNSPILTTMPADHWTFDEASGTVAANGTFGTDGTISSGVSVAQAGKVGRAYHFNGTTNAAVTAVGDKGIAGRGARTVSMWIKTGSSQNTGLISWGEDAAAKAWDFVLSGTSIRLNVNGGNRIGSTAIADDAWHHVVATYPGDDGSPDVADVVLYLDGAVEPSSSVASNNLNTASLLDVAIGVGRKRNVGFSGLIDDVAIWRSALEPGEVRALFELADNAVLNYNAFEAQLLLDTYGMGPGGEVVIGRCTWSYASGLTAAEDGELNVLGIAGSRVELVMDASAGTGMVGAVSQGTMLVVR